MRAPPLEPRRVADDGPAPRQRRDGIFGERRVGVEQQERVAARRGPRRRRTRRRGRLRKTRRPPRRGLALCPPSHPSSRHPPQLLRASRRRTPRRLSGRSRCTGRCSPPRSLQLCTPRGGRSRAVRRRGAQLSRSIAAHACTGARPVQRRGIGIYTVHVSSHRCIGQPWQAVPWRALTICSGDGAESRPFARASTRRIMMSRVLLQRSTGYGRAFSVGGTEGPHRGPPHGGGFRTGDASRRLLDLAGGHVQQAMTLAKAGKSSSSKYGGILRS